MLKKILMTSIAIGVGLLFGAESAYADHNIVVIGKGVHDQTGALCDRLLDQDTGRESWRCYRTQRAHNQMAPLRSRNGSASIAPPAPQQQYVESTCRDYHSGSIASTTTSSTPRFDRVVRRDGTIDVGRGIQEVIQSQRRTTTRETNRSGYSCPPTASYTVTRPAQAVGRQPHHFSLSNFFGLPGSGGW